jgi:alkanesulfonate monooxygenase SsuD/methylene tetrahydromethanopterin reductase-like flavin-dependent oxidoreductase (luciferase family)
VLFGGNSDAAVTRAARIGNGWFPYTITPDDYERQAELLRRTAASAGRDPRDIELTAWPGSFRPDAEDDVATVRRYVNAGAQRIVIRAGTTAPDDIGGFVRRVVRFREDILGQL